jgi:hypothetical protein
MDDGPEEEDGRQEPPEKIRTAEELAMIHAAMMVRVFSPLTLDFKLLTLSHRRSLALAEKMLCPWKIKATTELLRISSH